MATLSLTFGVGMTTLACMVPWLKRIKAGPGGFEAETRDPTALEVTTEVAEEGPAAFVQEAVLDTTTSLSVSEMDAVALYEIADVAVGKLLRPAEGPLAGCDLHLYMPDADDDQLRPIFEPPDGEPSEGWAPGQGATGQAWINKEYVVVVGEDTHNETYGLSTSQQIRYRDLAAVAASPVLNGSGDVIAVLSASTPDPATPLTTSEGFDEHIWLAFVVGRLLVDVLKWNTD